MSPWVRDFVGSWGAYAPKNRAKNCFRPNNSYSFWKDFSSKKIVLTKKFLDKYFKRKFLIKRDFQIIEGFHQKSLRLKIFCTKCLFWIFCDQKIRLAQTKIFDHNWKIITSKFKVLYWSLTLKTKVLFLLLSQQHSLITTKYNVISNNNYKNNKNNNNNDNDNNNSNINNKTSD